MLEEGKGGVYWYTQTAVLLGKSSWKWYTKFIAYRILIVFLEWVLEIFS